MACPYFDPVEPGAPDNSRQLAMLPLGGSWTGVCRATPDRPWDPDRDTLRACNLGYARGTCGRFPCGDGPDAVRFAIRGDEGGSLRVRYVVESNHHPFAHGSLNYSVADRAFTPASPAGPLRRQAQAYIESYLRRKAEASGR